MTDTAAIIRRWCVANGVPAKRPALRIVCADREQAKRWERAYREWRERRE